MSYPKRTLRPCASLMIDIKNGHSVVRAHQDMLSPENSLKMQKGKEHRCQFQNIYVADACFEFELRQVISLSSILFLKINFIHYHFSFL